jgi:hypothetical protein
MVDAGVKFTIETPLLTVRFENLVCWPSTFTGSADRPR